jgi:hypothetical protein
MAPYYSYPANYQDLVNGIGGTNGTTMPSTNEKVFHIVHNET